MDRQWRIIGATIVAVGIVLASAMSASAQGPAGRGFENLGDAFDRGVAFGHMGGRAGGLAVDSDAVAEALGLTVQELRSQLRDGATLADLAEANGIALQDLRDIAQGAHKASILERVAQALDEGTITEAFSSWFKRGADAGYTPGLGAASADDPSITAAAEALGMEPDDVSLQMWGGRTLADLAEKAGVELADVEAAVKAAQKEAASARIQQAVEDGRLTSEQAEWLLEGVDSGFGGWARFGAKSLDRDAMPMRGDRLAPDRR